MPMARWQSMLLYVLTEGLIMVGDDDDDGDIAAVDDDGSSVHR